MQNLLVVAVGLFLALQVAGSTVCPLVVQAQQLISDLPTLLDDLQGLIKRLQSASGLAFIPSNPNRLLETGIFAILQPAPLINVFIAFFPASHRQRIRKVF